MFQFSDLPELVNDYRSGEVDWMIAYAVLLRLLGDHEVSDVIAALSPELAARFDDSLHEEFSDEELAKTGLWIRWVEHAHQDIDAMLDTRMNVPVHEERPDELLGSLLQVIGSEAVRRWRCKTPGSVEVVRSRREVTRDHRISGHRSADLRRPPCERASPRGRAPPRTRSGVPGSRRPGSGDPVRLARRA